MESKVFRLINSPLLTDCLDYLGHRRNVASLSLFYRYFHADCSSEHANYIPPLLSRPCCTRLSISSNPYSVHLSNARVNQYLHSYILALVNSGTLFLCLFFHLPMTQTLSKEECQDTSRVKLDLHPCFYFSYCPLYRVWRQAGFVCLWPVRK